MLNDLFTGTQLQENGLPKWFKVVITSESQRYQLQELLANSGIKWAYNCLDTYPVVVVDNGIGKAAHPREYFTLEGLGHESTCLTLSVRDLEKLVEAAKPKTMTITVAEYEKLKQQIANLGEKND